MKPSNAKNLIPADNLAFCNDTDRYYSNTAFPRNCNTCDKLYLDRNQFLNDTSPLKKGTYSKGAKGKVLEYRNCTCGSTLACAVESKRNGDEASVIQREEFKRKMNFLCANGMTKEKAKEILLKRLNAQKEELATG